MSNQDDDSKAQKDFNKLITFRQAAYDLLGNGKDALFELSDAVMQMQTIQSFAELSCAPIFRRKWSSVYEALQDGRPDRTGLLKLYLEQVRGVEPLLLAGDHTAWEHLWGETLEGRSFQHQPSAIPWRRPVTIGHGYSTIVLVPEQQGSWALPLLHERMVQQTPVECGAQQLEQICAKLTTRPLSLWDSEYGCAAFLKATAQVKADKLIRLRTNLCLEGPTKPYQGHGPHPIHGIPFKFQDPSTWWKPDQMVEDEDPAFGPQRVQIWSGLRFLKALDCRMFVARVECLRHPGTRRKPRILWFAWVGSEPPEHWWTPYRRRYPVDHWYRFAKGRLHWTAPRVATPQQADRWSDLMPLLTWELWFAHALVVDQPLPWQKPQTHLAPGRVCQSMQNLLARIGTPTRVCKTRGIAAGWPLGKPRAKRARFELIRSKQWRINRARKKELELHPPPGPRRGRPKKEKSVQVA
jgi:hypothetical protein